jgi:hypothetical protein
MLLLLISTLDQHNHFSKFCSPCIPVALCSQKSLSCSKGSPLLHGKIYLLNTLHPELTKRIWADEKCSPLTTVVSEDHYSFVSCSWDAILDFLGKKQNKES